MAGQNGYQSNWTGAMVQNSQVTNQNGQQPFQFNNQQNSGFTPFNFNPNPLMIVPVSNEEAVNNYLVERGVTAFLINYKDGIFWTKRLNENGLGYDVIRHRFCIDEDKPQVEAQKPTQFELMQKELMAMQEELISLRKEFDEFIK